MINKDTERIISILEKSPALMGSTAAAEILGVTPAKFCKYLDDCKKLPSYAIRFDSGENRTYRILAERFALFLTGDDLD